MTHKTLEHKSNREIAHINSLKNTPLKLKVVLRELLFCRMQLKRHHKKYNPFANYGYYAFNDIVLIEFLKKKFHIFDLIPQLNIITWKKEGDVDCLVMPNYTLLQIHFKGFIIKLGF